MPGPNITGNPLRKSRRQKVFAVLPTLLTLGNATCGFGAITITAKVGPENFSGTELFLAAQLVFLAMLFDMLDGSAARLTNQTSDFGAQLDSLCDAISFGVAPAFIMLKLTYAHHQQTLQFVEQNLLESFGSGGVEYHARILWAIAVLFVLCALLRLARFNVETDEDDSHDYFSGLPSPAAAGLIASFPIGVRKLRELTGSLPEMNATAQQSVAPWLKTTSEWILAGLAIALPLITLAAAVLMVSRIRYPHVFNQFVRGQRSRKQLLQIVFSLVLVFVVRELAVPLIFTYFVLSVPCRAGWDRYVRQPKPTDSQSGPHDDSDGPSGSPTVPIAAG